MHPHVCSTYTCEFYLTVPELVRAASRSWLRALNPLAAYADELGEYHLLLDARRVRPDSVRCCCCAPVYHRLLAHARRNRTYVFDGPKCDSQPFGLGTQSQPLWFQMRYLCPVLVSPPSGDALVDGAWYRIFVTAQDTDMHKPVTSHFDIYNSRL